MYLRWTWDQAKSEANLRVQGVNFEAAVSEFDDPMSVMREAPNPYVQRWRTFGMVGTQIVMIVHSWPDVSTVTGEEIVRHPRP